ncbi:multicopper oxidase family protein [Microbacterium sp. No. 7]|uniref:multicopper oxidase family protein n=1 Tax=Microbacterium sp. No. 7 TaxID=1714373 RepID=UPI0006CFEF2E|nr:multicopper oxidase family protein [Microbacterium sp. No. 7]ALJ21595.1 oxidase [Microbacterium sp. No. 7]
MSRPGAGLPARTLGRRGFLRLGAVGAGAVGLGALGLGTLGLSGCASASGAAGGAAQAAGSGHDYILATDPEVAAAEAARAASGRTATFALAAAPALVDLGGRQVHTWAFGGNAVAPELRLGKGDRVKVAVTNGLPEDTTVHWHGIRIRNDMDGAAPATQAPIAPGGPAFDYDFIAPDPGTHWYHSHSGLQADRGLFGALIVEDPADATGADADAVLVLDDWVDGLGVTPDAVLLALNPALGGGHGGHGGASASPSAAPGVPDGELAAAMRLVAQGHGDSAPLGGMTQHIAYPLHLVNGRPPEDPLPVEAVAGQRLRLRVINAAAETPYRFAVAGHELTIVAVDGFDVTPQTADTVILGMAQRVDVLLTVQSGAWPIVAAVEGREGHAATVLRTADSVPLSGPLPASLPEHGRRLVMESELRPAASVVLDDRAPDRDYRVELIQAGDRYAWGMAGDDAGRLVMKQGERVRITMTNATDMWHPMHTHGHTFAVPDYGGLRRDTVNVLPGTELAIEFDADNPGEWMFHCHNSYHFEAGMTANLRYIR